MTLIQVYKNKVSVSEIRSSIEDLLITKIDANQEVFEAISRMGNYYGGSVFPARPGTMNISALVRPRRKSTLNLPSKEATEQTGESGHSRRYSVVYTLGDQYRHLVCPTCEQARAALTLLLDDKDRTPVGIYDDKTELFEWEHSLREEYEKASMREQGMRGEEIINITQALRRRDWDLGEFRRPSLFA